MTEQSQETLERELSLQQYPDAIDVTSYREITEILRSTGFIADPNSASLLARDPTGTKKTLHILNGPAHGVRRRTMNRLLRRDGHRWYRDTVLFPVVDRALADVRRELDAGKSVSLDLVPFGKRLFVQLAAALVGLDNTDTSERAEELLSLIQRMDAAHGAPHSDSADTAIQDGLKAKETFIEAFFSPAYATHQEVWRRFEGGELNEGQLPQDLMILLVAHADPEWVDLDLAVRESISMTIAPVASSVMSAVNTIEDLTAWFAGHPEDYERRTDRSFLFRSFQESLRMHTLAGLEFRQATEDVTLSGGTTLQQGQWAALRLSKGNLDASVYGPDASEFNPWRETPAGAAPYGLSFGAGEHMCYGVPIVLGNEGIDGSSVYVLESLFRLGVRPDMTSRPRADWIKRPTAGMHYESYPVVFSPQTGLIDQFRRSRR
jgi:cytochrome P450